MLMYKNMKIKNILVFFWEVFQVVAIALVIVLPIRYFVFQPFIVNGASMEPNFHDGDYLLIDELSYRFNEPQRGDVIVFKYPTDPSQRFIKRIVGLPRETIELTGSSIQITDKFGNKTVLNEKSYLTNNTLFSGIKVVLGEDEYFVMGDNRTHSFDSRKWGALAREYIVGRTIIRAWPPTAMASFFSDIDY